MESISSDNGLPADAYTEGEGENLYVAVQWNDNSRTTSNIKHVKIDGWNVKWKTRNGTSRKWTGKLLPWNLSQNTNEPVLETPKNPTINEQPDKAALEI